MSGRERVKDPKGSHKKKLDQERHFQGTQVPPNIARYWTFRYETFSLKKSMSISLDFAFYVTLRFRFCLKHWLLLYELLIFHL